MTIEAKCLYIVDAEVDPKVEAEWNHWYDTVHFPEALACPGVLAGRRYLISGQVADTVNGQRSYAQRRLYTAVYELSDPGAIATPEFLAMRGWYQFAPHVRSQSRVMLAR